MWRFGNMIGRFETPAWGIFGLKKFKNSAPDKGVGTEIRVLVYANVSTVGSWEALQ